MSIKALKITCNCECRYIAFIIHHEMFMCPNCGKSGADLEETYSRWMGVITETEWFEPPWFTHEEDYHSALISWLNDSDEEYTLYIDEDKILHII